MFCGPFAGPQVFLSGEMFRMLCSPQKNAGFLDLSRLFLVKLPVSESPNLPDPTGKNHPTNNGFQQQQHLGSDPERLDSSNFGPKALVFFAIPLLMPEGAMISGGD